MLTSVNMELLPWVTPNNVRLRMKSGEIITVSIGEIDEESLIKLCDTFRDEILNKAQRKTVKQ